MFILQIDNEEYGEALSLAQAYNLDSDLVYQRQWRKSPVSIASIQDYLVRDERWMQEQREGGVGETELYRSGSSPLCIPVDDGMCVGEKGCCTVP